MSQETWERKYEFQMAHEYRIKVQHEYDQKFRFTTHKFEFLFQYQDVIKIRDQVYLPRRGT